MSSSATVEAAWLAYIFQNASITDISSSIFAYPLAEVSDGELSSGNFEQKVNFWEYLISRQIVRRELGNTTNGDVTFTVEVRYTREKEADGTGRTEVRDAFETLISLVNSSLGRTWQSTVDFFEYSEESPQIEEIKFGGADCFRGSYKFLGFQYTTI